MVLDCKYLYSYFVLFCSRKIQFALVILLIGVGIATVTDLQLNLLGSVLAVLAIVTTCVAQIVSFSKFCIFSAFPFLFFFWWYLILRNMQIFLIVLKWTFYHHGFLFFGENVSLLMREPIFLFLPSLKLSPVVSDIVQLPVSSSMCPW